MKLACRIFGHDNIFGRCARCGNGPERYPTPDFIALPANPSEATLKAARTLTGSPL